MLKKLEVVQVELKSRRHPKCKGYFIHNGWGTDFDCEYQSILDCEECKYGLGKKDPEAKCNKTK